MGGVGGRKSRIPSMQCRAKALSSTDAGVRSYINFLPDWVWKIVMPIIWFRSSPTSALHRPSPSKGDPLCSTGSVDHHRAICPDGACYCRWRRPDTRKNDADFSRRRRFTASSPVTRRISRICTIVHVSFFAFATNQSYRDRASSRATPSLRPGIGVGLG